MGRRQGFFGDRLGLHYGRMRLARTIAIAGVLAATAVAAAEIPQEQRRSGFTFMTPETQTMQNDDTANPGMLWVLDGETLWSKKEGSAGKACADCHGDAGASMKGVAARYPAFDKALGRPVDLEQRINLCRTNHQQATPLPFEGRDLLAITAFIAKQPSGRASSTSPAATATRRSGTSGWRDRRSRRDTPRAIRFIGWNGRPSARCSA